MNVQSRNDSQSGTPQQSGLEFTGERFVPEEHGNIELEHWHRYLQARELAVGKDVLDIASGEGYGSALISEVARQVTGVDIAPEAVAHASARYQRPNLRYLEGNCAAIPLPDHSVDLIVSFETIEHHEQHEEMMREFKRVLRPDGLLLISNPDKHFYSEVPNYSNPYHVKELYEQEFKQLLSGWYKNTRYFGQRLVYGSAIFPETGASESIHYEMQDREIRPSNGLPRPLYWVALASDVELPALSTGLFEQDPLRSELLRQWKAAVKDQARLVSERDHQLEQRANQLKERAEHIKRLDAELEAAHEAFRTVTTSISWKASLPLREARRWAMTPGAQIRRYSSYAFGATRWIYRSIPFSAEARVGHRRFVQKYLPAVWRLLTRVDRGHVGSQTRAIKGTPYAEFPWQTTTIELPQHAQPLVSVIVPIYGKHNYTLRCLASIQRHLPALPFEVIVVDDCSPDESRDILAKVKGIRLVLNETNQGFLRSCNLGAKQARGQYLYFLNNDTEVTPGWLDTLIATFDQFPGTGLVGSKLVYPDGVLQEAGGIIWKDGSAWNFGRYKDQLDPVYCYARETDYCSGASIVVPAALYAELGGFDELYLPAYCEDSDLALRIRSRGYRVIYQPQSVIVHYEGVSNGTDLNSGVKAYQVENMRKQYERWKDLLATYQDNGVDVDRAKDRTATRRVLVVDHCTPTPDRDAGSVIIFNLMLLMREMGFQVTFVAEDNHLYLPGYTDELQAYGVEVLYEPYCPSVESHVKQCGYRYDLALLVRPGVIEKHLETVRRHCPHAKLIYHTVDLHYLRMQREAAVAGIDNKRDVEQMKLIEHDAIRRADASIVVSTAEQALLKQELPQAPVHVLPLIMDVPGTRVGFAERQDIIFVGGYQHTPNVDAVEYFVAEVLPLIHQKLPDVRLHVVGSNVPASIEALASERVIITGFVDDLQPLQDRMRVNVAPLRYGAGIKGKIGSAMAVGLPSVATTIATEGMGLVAGRDVLVGDDAQALADQVCQLYTDEALWTAMSAAGISFADQAWGARAAWKAFEKILDSVDLPVRQSKRPLSLWRPTSN